MKEGPKSDFNSIDEYLDLQTDEAKAILKTLRKIIKKAAPEAVEGISYQMPVFKFHGMIAYFAAFKNHCSIFVSPQVLLTFKNHLTDFKLTKSAIHFPFGQPIPEPLVTEIILYARNFNLQREAIKTEAKKKKIKSKN